MLDDTPFVLVSDEGIVVKVATRDGVPAGELASWSMGIFGIRVGDSFVGGVHVPRTNREWTRAQFLDRVKAYAPGSWESFLALKDGGNPVAKQIYEEGWVIRTVIEQRHPDTAVMLGALQAIGVLTGEQTDQIINGPSL